MNFLHLAVVIAMGGASLATFTTSHTLHADVFERPDTQISSELNSQETVFISCLSDVQPDASHALLPVVSPQDKSAASTCLR